MKRFPLLAITILSLSSCRKSDNTTASSAITTKPSIVSVTAFKAYSGSNQSVGFTVDLIADSTKVDDVRLYLYPAKFRWEVSRPSTGTYSMYDNIGDYEAGAKYNFIFHMHDGTTIETTPFSLP